jgi:hypothetical protein
MPERTSKPHLWFFAFLTQKRKSLSDKDKASRGTFNTSLKRRKLAKQVAMTTAALQCPKDPLENRMNLLMCDLGKGRCCTVGLQSSLFIPFTIRTILLFRKGELYPTSAQCQLKEADIESITATEPLAATSEVR